MKVYTYTNNGNREYNQDYMVWKQLSEDSYIYVLADGMGGYAYGDEAAKIVSDSIVEYTSANIQMQKISLIRNAIGFGNENLMLKRLSLDRVQMGTVIAVLLICSNTAYIAWLGDSRVYMFRNGNEVYRTTDHSYVEKLKASEVILSAEGLEKYSNLVTRCITGKREIGDIPVECLELEPSDTFILCSDGFHKQIPLDEALAFNERNAQNFDAIAHTVSDNFSIIKVVYE